MRNGCVVDYRYGKQPTNTHLLNDFLCPLDSPDPPWTPFFTLYPLTRYCKVPSDDSSRTYLSFFPSSFSTQLRSPLYFDEIHEPDFDLSGRRGRRRGRSHRDITEEVISSGNETELESLRSLVSFPPSSFPL